MTTTYVSNIAQAIDILRRGGRLPQSLVESLRDDGYDIPGLHSAYLNKN